VSREEAQHLKPLEYNGAIDPRRGGVILGALRSRVGGKKLRDDDWTRLRELGELALAKQDAGLGQIMAVLKQKGVWEGSVVVVMGDTGPGPTNELPYDPAGPMTEDRLGVPLIAKLPGRLLAGQDVSAAVTARDVSTTLARTLEVIPLASPAIDLAQRAAVGAAIESVAQVATLPGRYATRVGSWLLRGELGATPRLCAFDVDPACSVDDFEEHSIAARTLWLATLRAEGERAPAESGTAARTPVELDPETRAALVVWGDIPP
jgi:arylsulfatase A-like enzyme